MIFQFGSMLFRTFYIARYPYSPSIGRRSLQLRLPVRSRSRGRRVINPNEEQFEAAICEWLVGHGGYVAIKNDGPLGHQGDFDPVRGLDTAELFVFLGETQVDAWNEVLKRYGGDPNVAQAKFADRLAAELDKRGAVDVLRHGVVD